MEWESELSLESAKSSFLSLLASVNPCEAGSFVDWVIHQCSNVNGIENEAVNETFINSAETKLKSIIQDVRKKVPLAGILASENIKHPEKGQNTEFHTSTMVHIDSFLYNDDDIDHLCDEGKMSPFISHSTSLVQLRYMFQAVLPGVFVGHDLDGKLLVDVGSRLGAVLYGAYYFSTIRKIVGVEINNDLCHLQQEMIEKHGMTDRIEVRCADISKQAMLLKEADIVVLNNVFEFFLPQEEQIRTWKFLQESITKPGCIVVTMPSLEEATVINNQQCVDIDRWVEPCSLSYNMQEISSNEEDIEECQNIYVYQVKLINPGRQL